MDIFCIYEKEDLEEQAIIHNANVHKLFATAILLSMKFTIDKNVKTRHIVKMSRINIKTLNRLEIDFLMKVQFNLNISRYLFWRYVQTYQEQIIQSKKD